ncbi:acyl-CoA synthetase [Paracoccus sp. 1_MG-2023]|uniref:acyl-CoA synthetase n=1 Tax=unclassified Paracoccus (in: a-proteobacteria) TaxID=2688777 RepID=UPI001C082748|nr:MULTISPECIES: acyl-CoA synthetase [unclassified Paracoccus (in: a-proteobacteria)]MBU2959106.1 acyl-CoA synthetase [Paracoccus sp. C2R09]MDO6669390.1 acyl-CoA synthetase [Paracoccus sp. 1_MG-2023]
MTQLIYHTRYWAELDPARLAFHMCDTEENVSFAALEARANQGAHLMRNCGLASGDHLVILMENRREFLEICFAADRCGLYYTTVSTHLSEDELEYIIRDCGAAVLIASERFIDMGATIASRVPNLQAFALESWNDLSATQSATPIADESNGLDMLYSSGTTGRPKGVKWPMPADPPGSRTMLIDLLGGLFGYARDTRYLSPAPLYHAAPLRHSMVTIKSGGSAFIMSKFDAEKALDLIQSHRITHSQWVPTMFVRLLKLPEAVRASFDTSSMLMAVHAAAPCPMDVKQKMIDWWGPIIHEYYAGTENNGFVALDTTEWLTHPGSVGRAKLGIIHICDSAGNELPPGAEGEIYFENGHQFAYHNDPEKTAASRSADGWTTLGDIGRLDEEGYLYLTDRKSFVIISGGVNIYPQETENALLAHPQVLDAAVIGIPNEEFGEEVKAVVQTVSGTASTELEDELIKWCRARLSAIKCPRSIDFRAALPRTETGKLFKRKLWEEYRNTTTVNGRIG